MALGSPLERLKCSSDRNQNKTKLKLCYERAWSFVGTMEVLDRKSSLLYAVKFFFFFKSRFLKSGLGLLVGAMNV